MKERMDQCSTVSYRYSAYATCSNIFVCTQKYDQALIIIFREATVAQWTKAVCIASVLRDAS